MRRRARRDPCAMSGEQREPWRVAHPVARSALLVVSISDCAGDAGIAAWGKAHYCCAAACLINMALPTRSGPPDRMRRDRPSTSLRMTGKTKSGSHDRAKSRAPRLLAAFFATAGSATRPSKATPTNARPSRRSTTGRRSRHDDGRNAPITTAEKPNKEAACVATSGPSLGRKHPRGHPQQEACRTATISTCGAQNQETLPDFIWKTGKHFMFLFLFYF